MVIGKFTRIESFCASHCMKNDNWSLEKNIKVFSKCINNHGHNYKAYFTFKGHIDKDTGMVINLIDVKQILKPILDKVDHSYLNNSLKEELDGQNSTVEILAYLLFRMVQKEMKKYNLTAEIDNVRLYETDKNYADYSDDL